MKIDNGGPAFPDAETHEGMSLRDWFAGQSLAGIRGGVHPQIQGPDLPDQVAAVAYQDADAMLKARKESNDRI